jgi:hypothetical protein
MDLPDEMRPDFKIERKHKYSVMVEFEYCDIDYINNMENFEPVSHYRTLPEEQVSRREIGRIATKLGYVRFLSRWPQKCES